MKAVLILSALVLFTSCKSKPDFDPYSRINDEVFGLSVDLPSGLSEKEVRWIFGSTFSQKKLFLKSINALGETYKGTSYSPKSVDFKIKIIGLHLVKVSGRPGKFVHMRIQNSFESGTHQVLTEYLFYKDGEKLRLVDTVNLFANRCDVKQSRLGDFSAIKIAGELVMRYYRDWKIEHCDGRSEEIGKDLHLAVLKDDYFREYEQELTYQCLLRQAQGVCETKQVKKSYSRQVEVKLSQCKKGCSGFDVFPDGGAPLRVTRDGVKFKSSSL